MQWQSGRHEHQSHVWLEMILETGTETETETITLLPENGITIHCKLQLVVSSHYKQESLVRWYTLVAGKWHHYSLQVVTSSIISLQTRIISGMIHPQKCLATDIQLEPVGIDLLTKFRQSKEIGNFANIVDMDSRS